MLHGGGVDLVFSTCRCPARTDFDVVRTIGDAMPAVVFVTAFDHYALAAFEVHAFDYLLKPFSRARFQECVRRARTELEGRRRDAETDPRMTALVQELRGRRYLSRFVIREGGRVLLLDCARVDWIEAADNYAILHAGTLTYAIRETLGKLAADLDPQQFMRVHRSAIVRIDRVRELQAAFHGDFVISLHDGTRVAMSRSYRAAVEAVLGRPLVTRDLARSAFRCARRREIPLSQRERQQLGVELRKWRVETAGGDHDRLHSRAVGEEQRCRARARRQARPPHFLAVARRESADERIHRRADEDQTWCSWRGTAEARRTGGVRERDVRRLPEIAERCPPSDVAADRAHRNQLSPWRPNAGRPPARGRSAATSHTARRAVRWFRARDARVGPRRTALTGSA